MISETFAKRCVDKKFIKHTQRHGFNVHVISFLETIGPHTYNSVRDVMSGNKLSFNYPIKHFQNTVPEYVFNKISEELLRCFDGLR